MVIGLTGGIACGKSTAGKLFEKRGFRRLDADAIVHGLLADDAATAAEVRERFGDGAFSGGRIDRQKLGAIVFGEPAKLRELEEILHPKVRASWEVSVASDPGSNWVVEVPLLYEKNLENRFDLTVCVTSHRQSQVERLARKGMDQVQALARIHQQLPLSTKEEKADIVILNDGSVDFLELQIDRVIAGLA